jgi:hypothetical protein
MHSTLRRGLGLAPSRSRRVANRQLRTSNRCERRSKPHVLASNGSGRPHRSARRRRLPCASQGFGGRSQPGGAGWSSRQPAIRGPETARLGLSRRSARSEWRRRRTGSHTPGSCERRPARTPTLLYVFLERCIPSYVREWDAFVRAFHDGLPSPVGPADGRAPLVIGLAAGLSHRESRPVRVDEIGQ